MEKYKVLKRFRDLEKNETYAIGQEVELSEKRAKEINKKLKGYIEVIKGTSKEDNPAEPKKEEAKEDKK